MNVEQKDQSFFDQDYFENGVSTGKSGYDIGTFDINNSIFCQQAEMLHNILKLRGKKVLDIGCARCNLVHHLRDWGIKAYGVDISAWCKWNSHEPVYHILGDASCEKLITELDLVVSFESFEHIADIDGLLDNISRHLDAGGLLIFTTPVNAEAMADHSKDASSVSLHNRDWWHAMLLAHGFVERKDLFDKFFWYKLRIQYNWEIFCYEL